MIRKYFLSFVLTAAVSFAFGQNKDSVALVNAHWQKQKIAPRTKLISHQFSQKSLFLSNQNITYIEVKNKSAFPAFAIGAEKKVLKTTPTFGQENKAIAAINGTFFDIKNGGSVDFVKVNNEIVNSTRLEKNNKRARHQQAAIIIENGKLSLKKWDGTENWENNLTAENIMLSGPLLLLDKNVQTLDSTSFTKARHPRSAIGIKPNGKVILLTIDGRQENSAGASLYELTNIMKWLGCTSAINLDGGGSTTLWVSGATANGVVNFPSDNKKWDHEGSRRVANVIMLKGKE